MKKYFVCTCAFLAVFAPFSLSFAEDNASSSDSGSSSSTVFTASSSTASATGSSSTMPQSTSTPGSAIDQAISTPEDSTSTASSTTSENNTTSTSESVSINLDVESTTSTIFKGSINVFACAGSPSSTPTVNAYCAVTQSGVSSTWTLYGNDQFLDSAGGAANDFTNNIYWSWFSDLEYGQTSLNKHLLFSGDNLLVTLLFPLKISVATLTPFANGTDTISVEQFGFDASYNGIWQGASSSSVKIGDEVFPTDQNGNYILTISTTTPFEIKASKSGFLDSVPILIYPTSTISDVPAGSSFGAVLPTISVPGGAVTVSHNKLDANKALQFLAANQNEDGSFGSSLYTDWAAVAFGAASPSDGRDKIISYLKSVDPALVSATDYERHIMALMSLGINPYDGALQNYIGKLVGFFDGSQMGDPALVNDDIFAIFPLIKSGHNPSDPLVAKISSFIILKQETDGSWEGSVDLTAAGIQALSLISTDAARNSTGKAKDYLAARQQSGGGFGNSFSTSWVVQAINALGESPSDWARNNFNPHDYLYGLQQTDGGIESVSTDLDSRVWATSYAIPAALDKPWENILVQFSKPAEAQLPDSLNVPDSGGDFTDISAAVSSAPVSAVLADSSGSTALPRQSLGQAGTSRLAFGEIGSGLEFNIQALLSSSSDLEIFPKGGKVSEAKEKIAPPPKKVKNETSSLSGRSFIKASDLMSNSALKNSQLARVGFIKRTSIKELAEMVGVWFMRAFADVFKFIFSLNRFHAII